MSDLPHAQEPTCPNCNASLAGLPAPRYCPQCGQATALNAGGWRESALDSIGRYRRTLVALIAHPGQLTLYHIAGRRQRHVPPLRLYLLASFLFFLIGGLFDPGALVVDTEVARSAEPGTAASAPTWQKREARRDKAIAELRVCEQQPPSLLLVRGDRYVHRRSRWKWVRCRCHSRTQCGRCTSPTAGAGGPRCCAWPRSPLVTAWR